MSLAYMARLSANALTCDFAETYHILDWRALPARLAATLAVGLRENSRIKLLISGAKAPPEILLMAAAVDTLRILAWQNTKDGAKGRNPPGSILESLTGQGEEKETEGFDSVDAFKAWRENMLKGGGTDG